MPASCAISTSRTESFFLGADKTVSRLKAAVFYPFLLAGESWDGGRISIVLMLSFYPHLARKLDVKSVAEGVETQEEWDMLKSMNCDVGQGYFIAQPMDGAALLDFCTDYVPR